MASEDGGSTARLAVLIDADNAQPAIAGRLLAEIATCQLPRSTLKSPHTTAGTLMPRTIRARAASCAWCSG